MRSRINHIWTNLSLQLSSPFQSRLASNTYFRIRAGSVYLDKEKYRANQLQSPLSRFCYQWEESLQHILFDCQDLFPKRRKLLDKIKDQGLEPTIAALHLKNPLSKSSTTLIFLEILEFLKDINVTL